MARFARKTTKWIPPIPARSRLLPWKPNNQDMIEGMASVSMLQVKRDTQQGCQGN